MTSVDHSGHLYKWTNYVKRYKSRWFLLQGPLLSYYRNPENVNRRCRGTFNLKNATIRAPPSRDSFVIQDSSGRKLYLKASNGEDKIKWLKALSDAAGSSVQHNDQESDSFSEDSFSVPQPQLNNKNGRRWPFRNRTNRLKAEQGQTPIPSSIRKGEKTSPESASMPVPLESSDSTNRSSNDPTKNDPSDCYNTQYKADFDSLIHRFRRSSISVEASVLLELFSSVDIFRSRLRHHTDALCTQLSKIDSVFPESRTDATQSHDRPISPDACPACQQSIRRAVEEKFGHLKGLLGEHHQYAKEFESTCLEALQFLVNSVERWARRIQSEQERSISLERTVEQLARQHRALELQLSHCYASFPTSSSENLRGPRTEALRNEPRSKRPSIVAQYSEEDQFYDACSYMENDVASSTAQKAGLIPSVSMHSLQDVEESSCSDSSIEEQVNQALSIPSRKMQPSVVLDTAPTLYLPSTPIVPEATTCIRVRRSQIKPSPNIALNLWSLIKKGIGSDLTKIPLPVNFNEPISFLQRASEDLTYSSLLDKASECRDPAEQMALVAAFSVSCYASTARRTNKPFNPLLGETFELDRTDDSYGWRLIAEQVSHHPPGSALFCESTRYGWKLWYEFVLVSKFRGKSMSILPQGIVNLILPDGSRYTWNKATTVVHNLIVGSLWIDNRGDVLIQNHTNRFQCPLKFIEHSYFSRGPQKRVSGVIQTPTGVPVRTVQGCWDSYVESQEITADGDPISEPVELWCADPLPPDSDKYYNFSKFTIELNEPEPNVAPTDSRLRPDQRLMEDGAWDAANNEKLRLEQKQRAKRYKWEEQQATGVQPLEPLFTPLWFKKCIDPVTGEQAHMYLGNYWQAKANQDWHRCPDIF